MQNNWPFIWYCNDCGASVGCHVGTNEPLGPMALARIRLLRRLAHVAFDDVWLCGFMSRARAKRWAKDKLNLATDFHISSLTFDQLKQVIKFSEDYLKDRVRNNVEQLKVKNHARVTREIQRTNKLNSLYKGRRKRKR
jgi:hypothetical protein